MPTILERLREALAPDYQVEREIARGGMGIVFQARDSALERVVAVKIIRPEMATARAAERFLREARLLATLQHPNVVPVHKAGQANGFFYYVMDYVEGPTLADRLREGPLPRDEVLKLGRDMLDALEAAHTCGIVHRDLKPTNVFLTHGRAVVSDFGIAKPTGEAGQEATTEGRVVGTVGYMAPEQAYGQEVTAATDIYALGVVLYEAYTGRNWSTEVGESRPNWSGVPRGVVPILRRALAFKPEQRWPDARSFRRALWRTRTRKYRRKAVWFTSGGVVAGGAVAVLLFSGVLQHEPLLDVAVIPFTRAASLDSALAANLTLATHTNLEHSFLRVANRDEVSALWREVGATPDSLRPRHLAALRVRSAVLGTVSLAGTDTLIAIRVMDRDGATSDAGQERFRGSLAQTGRLLGLLAVRMVAPNRESEYGGSAIVARDSAFNAYIGGLQAFERNEFRTATERFTAAWEAYPEWGLAQWWLSNAHRWTGTGLPHPEIDLRRLRVAHRDDLPELQKLLIDAQLAPTELRRLTLYRAAIERYPHSGYAAFVYGDELLMRGPHVGIPVETAVTQLESATRLKPNFGPAHCELTWAYIRLGREADARNSARRCQEVSAGPGETDVAQGPLMQLLVTARFNPEQADAAVGGILANPQMVETIGDYFRLGAMYDLAGFQADLGSQFLMLTPEADHATRAHLLEGRGLGLIGLGQIQIGLRSIDQAAALFGTVASEIEAAEWRVVGNALGLPGVTGQMLREGRTRLRNLLDNQAVRARAAWALGIDAARDGDGPTAEAWLDTLARAGPDSAGERLATLLEAVISGHRGDLAEALDISANLLPYDSAGRGGDPFARAVLHLERAAWLDRMGRHAEADASRLWYQQFEWVGIPAPMNEAESADVDWALSTYARWLRGTAPHGRETGGVCADVRRVLELWSGADEAYRPLAQRARDVIERQCAP